MTREDRRRRRLKARRKRSRRRRFIFAGLITVVVLAAVTVGLRRIAFSPPPATLCTAPGDGTTTYKLTADQAVIATTVAASAKRLRLSNHAVTVGLATALQESGLRNLDYGDRDSLGVFQQRPSMGWGTKRQVQNPRYSASAFFIRLAALPGWEALSVNDAAQAIQRSAFPKAYGKWETQARALARDFTGEVPLGLSCRYTSLRTFVDQSIYPAMLDELGTTGTSLPDGGPSGWTVATWLVAHARQYSVHTVSYAGYRWTTKTATWQAITTKSKTVTFS